MMVKEDLYLKAREIKSSKFFCASSKNKKAGDAGQAIRNTLQFPTLFLCNTLSN
jgi:hypothetical protein